MTDIMRPRAAWDARPVARLALEQGLRGDKAFNFALARYAKAVAADKAEAAEIKRRRAESAKAGWAKRRAAPEGGGGP